MTAAGPPPPSLPPLPCQPDRPPRGLLGGGPLAIARHTEVYYGDGHPSEVSPLLGLHNIRRFLPRVKRTRLAHGLRWGSLLLVLLGLEAWLGVPFGATHAQVVGPASVAVSDSLRLPFRPSEAAPPAPPRPAADAPFSLHSDPGLPSSSSSSSDRGWAGGSHSANASRWPSSIVGAFLAVCTVAVAPLAMWGWVSETRKETDGTGKVEARPEDVGPETGDLLCRNDKASDDHLDYWQSVRAMVGTAWPLILGNTLEWYEFSAYGYLIPELQANFF
eukprot:EG_transcript_23416